jgi:hypothetical protein
MKTKMKKLISIKSIPIIALAMLIILGTVFADIRDPVSGSGLTFATGPNTFAGIATLIVRGKVLDAEVEVALFEPPVESEDGVLHVNAIEHIFIFSVDENEDPIDSFTVTGKEVADPTDTPGLYILNGYMKIICGTGAYEGVSGEMSVHGTIDFRELPSASFDIHGAISR